MEFHEAADLFPLDEATLDALAEDIRTNGQHETIKILAGKILDGRRRYLACQKLGIKPKCENVNPPDPIAYSLSLNLHRRHLEVGQRAMVGARAREMYAEQAKERQRKGGGDKKSARAKSGVETLPHPIEDRGAARDHAGKAVGVSGKAIDLATRILNTENPELIAAVDEDRLSVFTAGKLASQTEAEQNAAAERSKTGRRRKRPRAEQDDAPEPETNGEVKEGKGVRLANEAINCLSRIPKNDPTRKLGFQIVKDWIRRYQ